MVPTSLIVSKFDEQQHASESLQLLKSLKKKNLMRIAMLVYNFKNKWSVAP